MDYVKVEGERFVVRLMYAGMQNMSGRAVYQETGWGNVAVVHRDLFAALQKTVPVLEKHNLYMLIFDAYRLPEAHNMLVQAVPFGLFAPEPKLSAHCHATAVDVCLANENLQPLKYPTPVDDYTPENALTVRLGNIAAFQKDVLKARHDYQGATAEEKANRLFLKKLMEGVGLESLAHEWWHYSLPDGLNQEKYPLISLFSEDFS